MSWSATRLKCAILCGAAVVALASGASAAEARAPISFDISKGELAQALHQFSLQSNQEVLFSKALLAGHRSAGFSGLASAEVALARLLDGTDLTYRVSKPGVLLVVARQPMLTKIQEPVAGGPVAAAAPSSGPAAEEGATGVLQEVVVTATRQVGTVNTVPLSMSAQTQRMMDQQGLKTIGDLARSVPALTVANSQAGVATYAIRGIVGTTGAATTGLYLDDTALQKRSVACASFAVCGNGTPAPVLFDLERVEVLRGPQGTLYGGSSQGGTIRFITPAPSLTRYSGYGRAELSNTDYGGWNYEAGVATGGPIVRDKLGFRASIFGRRTSGYIDYLNPYDGGSVRFKDSNSSKDRAIRLSLAWAPTERGLVTLAYYGSVNDFADVNSSYNLPVKGTFTTVGYCYNATSGNPPPAVTCGPGVRYSRPSATYGPFPYLDQPFNYINVPIKTPAVSHLDVTSLTFDYDFGGMTAKLITSYMEDKTKNQNYEVAQVTGQQRTTLYPTSTGFPLFSAYPDFPGIFFGTNRRRGFSEELRFTSAGDHPLTWVAGAYYSYQVFRTFYTTVEDTDGQSQSLFGITGLQRYGVPRLPTGDISHRDQLMKDLEVAGFGEATYRLTDKLRLIGGLRVSRVQFDYRNVSYGQASGYNDPYELNASGQPRGVVSGSVSQSPITPRFGIQYNLSSDDMLYANAAKGFRAGGVNPPITNPLCVAGLAVAGLTLQDVPVTFGSDTVWSYEAGAKLRLFDKRVQLNASAYRIDWTGVQLAVGVAGCLQTWVQNAGAARSDGFDLQLETRVVSGLTASVSVGYNRARYTESASGPKPLSGAPAAPVVQAGDQLPVAPWTVTLGAQYTFDVFGKYSAFVRADYQYASGYHRGLGFGVASYTPDTYYAVAADNLNARVGINIGRWEVDAFANNLLNSRDALGVVGGRSGCSLSGTAACDGTTPSGGVVTGAPFTNYNPLITQTTFRPRTVGVQAFYRF